MKPHSLKLVAVGLIALSACARAGSEAPTSGDGGAAPALDVAAPTAGPGNLLVNPGFEDGSAGWKIMEKSPNWAPFEIVSSPVRSGKKAVHLEVDWKQGTPGRQALVFGVLQEPKPLEFPDTLSGWYRIESWDRGGPETDLYLQAVVIVWKDPRTASIVDAGNPNAVTTNYQIRYYITGLEEPPFLLTNAKRKFLAKGEPRLGEWVYFETNVRRDFEELWGVVPSGYEFVRVLFEGRWDNKPEGQGVHADVYYDDLFFGYGKPVK